jgi:hypothetical protein
MVKVRILVLGAHGAYSRKQEVRKSSLGKYIRIQFRGKPTYVMRDTLSTLAEEADTRREEARPVSRGMLPSPPPTGGPNVLTEEFFVRDNYKGGGRKRGERGRSKGKNSSVSIDLRVSFTGTRQERNDAFERLEQMFLERMPFLSRQGGLIGREVVEEVSASKVRVLESRLNGVPNRQIGRNVYFDLEAV